MGRVLIAVLGPLEVSEADKPVPVAGTRLRTLLARLALDTGRVVPSAELVDAVWGQDPPAEAANALQTLVSRLRRALADRAQLQQVGTGYQLSGVDVDVDRFSDLLSRARAAARAHDSAAAVDLFDSALSLWRGAPLADVGGPDWAGPVLVRLDESRGQAIAGRAEAALALGMVDAAIGDLETAVADNPWNEPLTVLLMRALAEAGRVPEALSRYEKLRRQLAGELGTDPGPDARELHVRLLQGAQPGDTARPSRRTNLRSARTSFLGREAEIGRLAALLEAGRLATIVGPGGAGKSRLAGVVAADWVGRLADGVWFVELAPVTDEHNLPQALLGSLGLRGNQVLDSSVDATRLASSDRLLDVLADAECLLVVDNCEHLITGVAALLDDILARCPQVRVLTTSREPLGIDGEALCVLPPLTLPPVGASAEQAAGYSSVQLFCDRARAVIADFRLDDDTVEAVVEIVGRLDGLPLAIELATARLRVLPVEAIAARLSDRFRLLTGGSRVAMPRHRTLRAVVEWSWELLSPAERLLAERLAVFPSGATASSAVAVCADDRLDADEVEPLLGTLVEKSLVGVDSVDGLRYRMLETIREYGIERLAERGELDQVRLAHARHYARLSLEAEAFLRTGDQLAWIRRLEAERDNILAALRYLGSAGLAQEAVDLVNSMGWYWILLGNHSEAATWMRFVLDVDGPVTEVSRLLCEATFAMNSMATLFSESDQQVVDRGLVGVDRVRADIERIGAGDAHPMFALLLPLLAFFSDERAGMEEMLERTAASPDPWIRATGHMFRANLYDNDGDVDGMRVDAQRAYELFEQVGDRWGLGTTLQSLADLKALDGDLEGAVADYSRAAHLASEIGATDDEVMMHVRLTDLHLRRGDLAAARRESELARDQDVNAPRTLRIMADLGAVAVALETHDEVASRTLQHSLAVHLEAEMVRHPMSGRVRGMGLAMLASLMVVGGDLDGARDRLVEAYEVAVGTRDMPVIAQIGVAVADHAAAIGDHADAAELLGACATLRGADDRAARLVQSVRTRAVAGLGSVGLFEEHYATGRALDREEALERIRPAAADRAQGLARLSEGSR